MCGQETDLLLAPCWHFVDKSSRQRYHTLKVDSALQTTFFQAKGQRWKESDIFAPAGRHFRFLINHHLMLFLKSQQIPWYASWHCNRVRSEPSFRSCETMYSIIPHLYFLILYNTKLEMPLKNQSRHKQFTSWEVPTKVPTKPGKVLNLLVISSQPIVPTALAWSIHRKCSLHHTDPSWVHDPWTPCVNLLWKNARRETCCHKNASCSIAIELTGIN